MKSWIFLLWMFSANNHYMCQIHEPIFPLPFWWFLIFMAWCFFTAARLGDIRANHDPCVTYEGANHVLLQQTSRWLLRAVDEVPDLDFDSARFPASELEFLRNFESNLSLKFSANSVNEVLRVDCKWQIIMTQGFRILFFFLDSCKFIFFCCKKF